MVKSNEVEFKNKKFNTLGFLEKCIIYYGINMHPSQWLNSVQVGKDTTST
jgi:hypothetical protein